VRPKMCPLRSQNRPVTPKKRRKGAECNTGEVLGKLNIPQIHKPECLQTPASVRLARALHQPHVTKRKHLLIQEMCIFCVCVRACAIDSSDALNRC